MCLRWDKTQHSQSIHSYAQIFELDLHLGSNYTPAKFHVPASPTIAML